MPEPVRGDQRYLPGLDGLRALAVAAVVAYHLGYGWAQGGLLGVGVFFTLSGYLITDILAGQFAAKGRIRLGEFWMRRARRLLPALFLMLALVAVWVNLSARSFLPGFRGDVIASMLYVSNWWYIGQHASYYAQFGPPAPLDHLWSLAVEEQFYLVWPWLVLLLVWWLGRRRWRPGRPGARDGAGQDAGFLSRWGRWRMAGLTIVLAVASMGLMARSYHPGYDPTRVYEGTDTRAFGLLIGAALAMVLPSRRAAAAATAASGHAKALAGCGMRVARWLADLAGLAGLATIGLLVWKTNQYSPVMFRGGLGLLSVATAVVVTAVVLPGSLLGRLLGCGPLRWLGVRSYGIYLWHYPVTLLAVGASAAGAPVSAPRAVAVIAGTVVVAALSWRLVEEPIRRGWRNSRRKAGDPAGRAEQRLSGRRVLTSRPAVGGICLLTAVGLAVGVTSVTSRLASGTIPGDGNLAPGAGPLAQPGTASDQAAVAASPAMVQDPRPSAGARSGAAGLAGAGPVRSSASQLAPPPRSTPPPRTSCREVVHIGDSTSEGLTSASYLPDPRQRITAQYARVGVHESIMRIVGATSVVESLPGTQNAFEMASALVHSGYHGCWVLALGTNDTADVFAGSNVGRVQRIEKMMKLIGSQPVLWVAVKSLLSSGPYSERDMLLWDRSLAQVAPHYPAMRIYDWPAVVQRQWFISDGIHFTSAGYAARGRLIANALAAAFPAR